MKCPVCQFEARLFYENMYDDRYGYPGQYNLYQCPSCEHLFLDARFNDAEMKTLYTDYYPRSLYRLEDYHPHPPQEGFDAWFAGSRRAFAEVPLGVRVLDIGCGFGESLGYHKNRGCDVYGVEADENILRVAERFGFKVKVGVFNSKDFDADFFDYVTMDQVLEHSQNPMETMQVVARILKPGGRLVVTFPNANGWGRRVYGKKWVHWHVPYHIQFYSKKSLQIAAEKSGLKVATIKYITDSHWLFYQQLHLLKETSPGEPALFWSSKTDWSKVDEEINQKRDRISKWHDKKLNHVATRLFDFLRMGDNLLVVMEKR